MRITAPTFTQTPNDLFDHWLPLLGEIELKVLLVIMRKTFGWHRTRDFISISQLSQLTGSNQSNVIRAAKSLMGKGLIKRIVEGTIGKQVTYYELIVNEDSNNSYPSQIERGNQNRPLPNKEGTPPKLRGTKETHTKEKTIVSVCVAAPPVAASPLLKIISLKTFEGKELPLSYQDLFDMAIKQRKDWIEKEIDELWKILENYKSPMRDLALFCDGTIKNMRKMKKIKEFEIKEKTCQTTMKTNENKNVSIEKSQNTKEKTSENVMWEQVFPNWREEFGLPKRYPIG